MAARSGTVPWFDNFDVAAEVEILTAHIERWTEFALPARKRDVIMSFAKSKLETTRLAYREAKAAGKPVSTSRRAYLTDLQDTIFMAIPEENLALMPLSEQVLNDPSFYADAMHRAAAISEDELFMALSSSLKDMTVQDARAFVSKLWHSTIDDNARKYAEALKRPEREIMPLRPGNTSADVRS
ncbi:hypothetical protein PGB28_19665 [Primorskyibacter aestuariivivens]|uniref:hypothetical protein n=1 Tax=Primorskyibacter aestuariivivens TaxID=1888912 RepID=UPI0022FFD07A|nr:hypothetical protein [Primorskyibacter aestuariivivens]MDA7430685.1 hypothetical protein [Primorskyibacter aestuariivivens]